MSKRINLSQGKLQKWEESFIPEKDIFFLREQDEHLIKEFGNNCLLFSKEEFSNHPTYAAISYASSYTYWTLTEDITTVVVLPHRVFPSLNDSVKKAVLTIQHEVGRGLIFESHYFDGILREPAKSLLAPYEFVSDNQQYIAIQKEVWNQLPKSLKSDLLNRIAYDYDTPGIFDPYVPTESMTSTYVNTYPNEHGPNCLSSTLFVAASISSGTLLDWIIKEWVHPTTFMNGLKQLGYKESPLSEDAMFPHDILVWRDKQDRIVHASFHIDKHYFFNKNGQTFFNPWKTVHMRELEEEWGKHSVKVYRK